MKKKVLAAVLSFCMIVSMIPATAFAVVYQPITIYTNEYYYDKGDTARISWYYGGTEEPAYYTLYMDDNPVQTWIYGRTTTYTLRTPGNHTFKVEAYGYDYSTGKYKFMGQSDTVTVSVGESYDEPEITTDLPSTKRVNSGENAKFDIVIYNPDGVEVTWEFYENTRTGHSSTKLDSGKVYTGGSISSAFKANIDDNGNGYYFKVSYVDKQGTVRNLYSQSCTLTVNSSVDTPSISISPSYTNAYVGNSITLSANARSYDGGHLTYQWYFGTNSSFSYATAIVGATSATYSGYAPATAGTYYYFCEVTNTLNGQSASDWAKSTVSVGTIAPTPTAGSMNNFRAVNTYYPGLFVDVKSTDWFAGSVQTAYQIDLIKGYSTPQGYAFQPDGSFTVAEALAVACRLHSIYYTGSAGFNQGAVWYQVYVDYAIANGIIKNGDFVNYTLNCTRAQMAYIFAHSLPSNEFGAVKSVTSIPDVNAATPYSAEIYTLYNAGVLTGSDAKGTFNPYSNIKRSEVAAIISRVAIPNTRVY